MQLSATDKEPVSEAMAPLTSKLAHAIDVVDRALGKDSGPAKRLSDLRLRLQGNHLQVAILGQFKRGKSTFVNALLGAPILPTGVVPLTAVPTFIGWNERPLVRISFLNGRPEEIFESSDTSAIEEFLSRFVTEERNPENAINVERVSLLYPAPLLRDGTVFIDTPGIGSTFLHNTQAALRVIPECDASLFIVSADPPITQAELDYLRSIRGKIGHMLFVINKVDYFDDNERQKTNEFLRTVLAKESLLDSNSRIFEVSAKNALSAKQHNDGEALEVSGVKVVETHLKQFLQAKRVETLRAAIDHKAGDVLLLAEAEVSLRLETLIMPLDILEQKANEFDLSLRLIESKRIAIGDMLTGERRRLVKDLEVRFIDLRKKITSRVTQQIGQMVLEDNWEDKMSEIIENEFSEAREIFVSDFSWRADGVVADYQRQIEALISDVRRTAADMFRVAFTFQDETERFRIGQEPYWVTECVQTGLLPDLSPFIDRFLPGTVRQQRRRQRAKEQTKELIIRNAENLRWAILRGVDETFRAVTAHFDEMLRQAMEATKGVVDDAVTRRGRRSFESAPAVQSLKRYKDELAEVRNAFVTIPEKH
jgi:GTP-binding protein EngB required for normal cell division